METLSVSAPTEELGELQEIAMQFDELSLQQQSGMQQQPSMQQRIQTTASTFLQHSNIDQQQQYIQAYRRIQQISSSTSMDSTTQTGHAGTGDWQEETYQMVKRLKDLYFAEIHDLSNEISLKLHHVDSLVSTLKPSAPYEKMKNFKLMLDRTLQFLQINKSNIQPAMRDKIPLYERQIIYILDAHRKHQQKQFLQSAGQTPSSRISQQRDLSQGLL